MSADLDTIQDRGHLVVAVKDTWRPLGFIDEKGELVGFEIDLARQLAADLLGDPNAIQLRPVSNVERLPAVLNGQVDMAIAGVTITPMRQRLVAFSLPYYLDGTGFVTRQPHLQSISDLGGSAIALLQGSDAVAHIHYLFPFAPLLGVPSYQRAWETLETNQADAFGGNASVLAGWVQEHPNYHLLPELVTVEPLAVVLPKGTQNDSLRREVNGAIAQLQDSGWLAERIAEWGLP
ncbi:MAG: transporter substrate-binding domain-containing protein [Cyanobacteria bacterium]|nr:transporter substrate-binding domain-containing protein [Cyanobacteriota bacterium]